MAKWIIRIAALILLGVSFVLILLVLHKPNVPVVEVSADASRSFDEKMAYLVLAQERRLPAEIRLTEAEINSKIQEALKSNPPPPAAVTLKGATVLLQGEKLLAVLMVSAKGVELQVAVAGSLDFSNHTLRLIPSEVHVGSLPVPASWLQGRLDMHMEIPAAVTAMRVENGELVVEAH